VERLTEPGFRRPTGHLCYNAPLPIRLKTATAPSLHSSCEKEPDYAGLNDLLHSRRWLPRWLRPYFYQHKFDALLLAVIEARFQSRFLALPPSVDLCRLKQISGRPGMRSLFADRREFDRAIREVISAQPIAQCAARGRHARNVQTVRVLERLSRNS
jgi:hypothetical protein